MELYYKMITIIAGSRNITNYSVLIEAIKECGWIPTAILSGGASGVDKLGERYAKENSIPLERYVPNWAAHGKAAGIIRNQTMAALAESLIAVWDGKSKGTKNMLNEAKKRGLKIYLKQV